MPLASRSAVSTLLQWCDSLSEGVLDDIQDLDTSHASEIWAKYINKHTGRRSDAATGDYMCLFLANVH